MVVVVMVYLRVPFLSMACFSVGFVCFGLEVCCGVGSGGGGV